MTSEMLPETKEKEEREVIMFSEVLQPPLLPPAPPPGA